jgi:hypothetical protein
MGTHPFRVFHDSLGSTYCTLSELESRETAGEIPLLVPTLDRIHGTVSPMQLEYYIDYMTDLSAPVPTSGTFHYTSR